MRVVLPLALAAMLAAGVLSPGPAQAQFGLFLGNRGTFQLTDEDWQLFRDAVVKALQPPKAGNRAEWQNPKTNMRGDVVVEKTLQKEGAPCALLRARFIRTEEQTRHLTFCRDAGGQWVIAPG
ncbi:hypothetical protein [Azospirillum rugosum]|uniref:Surface antigen n=1 Tax=Azospirillum rugosum TaxID=416170 RepID=A0ABS4SHX4_9PROT|nr:hypothetical protein [Azospirillum rugosum]MBP2291532.1 surface antigen [Azospirillum rugosum]MDQ0525320.1 surface antigen [Azospirillum rugosum]